MGNRQRGERKGKEALRAEMARRRRLQQAAVAGIVLVVVAGIALKVLGDRPEPPSPNVAEDLAGGPVSLVFADFTPDQPPKILRFDIADETEHEVAELPRSATTTASPTSKWVTIVELAERGDRSVPVLYLFDPETEEETEVGPGVTPIWKADGTAVAYAEPLDLERCNVVDCPGDKRVIAHDPAAGESTTLIEGSYRILFWSGDRLLLSDIDKPDVTVSVSPDGSTTELDLRSSQIWGASPDGQWLLSNEESGTTFLRLSENGEVAEEVEVNLTAGTLLGGGGWAFDSSAVAAVVEEVEDPRLVIFSPDDLDPQLVAEGLGSITRALWSPANDGLFLSVVSEGIGGAFCKLEEECSELDFNGDARLPLRLE